MDSRSSQWFTSSSQWFTPASQVRGLALGGTAHGGGLLALSDEPEAFPFAAVMMNLAGVCAVCLVSAPPLRRLLVSIALG